ncbi:MAG: LysE family translocator [Micromonosporaceae bacterium]
MPSTQALLGFTLASLVLILIPGPNLVYIVTRSATQGWRAGLASALGVETGTLAHLGLAAVGVSSLLAASPVAFAIVRYAGAAYLVYLAVRAFRSRSTLTFDADADAPRQPLHRVYADGVLVNVLNPKVALFFLAFLPQFISPSQPALPQLAVYATVFLALGLLLDLGYAALGGSARRLLDGRTGTARWSAPLTAGIYVALASYALLA